MFLRDIGEIVGHAILTFVLIVVYILSALVIVLASCGLLVMWAFLSLFVKGSFSRGGK